MAKNIIKNIEASARDRLLNLSRTSGENYNAILLRFFQERFLARLGFSPYQEHFVLKGGLLLLTEHVTTFRPTVDIDMLGIEISNDPEKLTTIIKEIAGKELNDNVRFDTERISYGIIKEELDYQGLRFILTARLGKIR